MDVKSAKQACFLKILALVGVETRLEYFGTSGVTVAGLEAVRIALKEARKDDDHLKAIAAGASLQVTFFYVPNGPVAIRIPVTKWTPEEPIPEDIRTATGLSTDLDPGVYWISPGMDSPKGPFPTLVAAANNIQRVI